MRKLVLILAAAFTALRLCAQTSLDRSLAEYLAAMESLDTARKTEEADFIIGSCDRDSIRDRVAVKVYEHFLNSPVMGDEAVAIHVTDKWFATGRAKMMNDIDLINARIYADFNRSSLIGMKAPALRLRTPDGSFEDVLGGDGELAGGCPRLRVLFFYDTSCASCRMETILLRSMFGQRDYCLDFLAVDTASDRDAWTDFISRNLDFNLPSASLRHFWDPDRDSGYEVKYGVLQTPRMYLIGTDGTILGRNLDTQALMSLLDIYDRNRILEYGGEESMAMFSRLLPADGTLSAGDFAEVARLITDRTLGQADTLGFRQLAGDMLYYTSGRKGELFSDGASYVADSLVLSRNDIWVSRDDSLKVVGMASLVHDMMRKSVPGTRLPKMRVPGKLRSGKGDRDGIWRLDSSGKGGYLMFYIETCGDCSEEVAASESFVRGKGVKVLMVDVDRVMRENPQLGDLLFDSFDLSSLPFILKIGAGGRISGRYLSFVEKQK